MRMIGIALLIVGLSWGVASVPAGATATLKSELLTRTQLTSVWVVAATESIELPGCKATALPATPSAQASAHFEYKVLEGFPQINEVLAAYRNVSGAFKALAGGLNNCKNVRVIKNGKSFTITISKLVLGAYGDQSAAFSFALHGTAPTLSGDVLVVRKGTTLMELQQGARGSTVSIKSFESLSKLAVSRIVK